MSGLFDYSTTPASNNSASPNGWPEGMAPSGLNDSDREFAARTVGALKAFAATGTNAQSCVPAPAHSALVTGMAVHFIAGGTNTGAATFAPNGLTAKNLYKPGPAGPTALTGNEVVSGNPYSVRYDGTQWVLESPGPGYGGKVLQSFSFETGALATGTTQTPNDNSIPQVGEGTEFMSCSLTPFVSSSVLLVDITAVLATSSSGTLTGHLHQNGAANAIAAACITPTAANAVVTMNFRHKLTSAGITATTFSFRAGANAVGTTTFNGSAGNQLMNGVMASSITVTEIMQP